jgi:hypothetical protein
LPVTVHAVTVQEVGIEQMLEHHRHAADPIEIDHVELAARLHVGDVRNASRDTIEVVEVEIDLRLVRDRQ